MVSSQFQPGREEQQERYFSEGNINTLNWSGLLFLSTESMSPGEVVSGGRGIVRGFINLFALFLLFIYLFKLIPIWARSWKSSNLR